MIRVVHIADEDGRNLCGIDPASDPNGWVMPLATRLSTMPSDSLSFGALHLARLDKATCPRCRAEAAKLNCLAEIPR